MAKKSIRVGFAWQTLTSENLGVTALAEANLAIARKAASRAGVDIQCIEFCPSGSNIALAKLRNCEIADPLSIKKIVKGESRFVSQLRACDLMLDIGAGDSFADIYGAKHFMFLALTKFLARVSSVPLVLSPQTIGPFESSALKRIAVMLMKGSRQVFARDGMSMQYLSSLGVVDNAREVIDVAFRLPFDRIDKAPKEKIQVGVNVSGLLFNGGYTKNNQFGLTVDYSALVYELLDVLAARSDVCVHLVGHVISDTFEVEDDYRVLLKLQQKYPSFLVAPKFGSPSEAKTYISGLDFFTGARMHACIGAFSSGTPVVPMAYSRKFNGLFESLGYTHISDLKKHNNSEALSAILSGIDKRESLRQEVARGNEIAQQKIQKYEDYLVSLFEELKNG
jgi:colanic acid/amylovoran biosynthesis protein